MKKWLFILIPPLLFLQCSPVKRSNTIGIYYQRTTPYADREMIKDLSRTAFVYNYSLIFQSYEKTPRKRTLADFSGKGAKIILLEEHDAQKAAPFYRFCRSRGIRLTLITSVTTSQADLVLLSDYRKLGSNLARQLYEFSRSKRNVFVLYYKKDYKRYYYKLKLMEGYHDYFQPSLTLITNLYSGTNYQSVKKDIYQFITLYGEELRGILTDDDRIAEKTVLALKNVRKEGEIQVSGFGGLLNGINCIIKIGLCVTGDMNRYALFQTALTNSIQYDPEPENVPRPRYFLKDGIYYNQINTLDNLALTRKFSIQQILDTRIPEAR
ncbi:MAG: hypothetical protein PHF84_12365 [bacterium]|nr:hypothetical protein [bacterium]